MPEFSEAEYESCMTQAESLSWLGGGVRELAKCVESVKDVPGSIVECGTFRGGSALALGAGARKYAPEKSVISIDTFAGMPTGESWEPNRQGEFKSDLDKVATDLASVGNVTLFAGDISEVVRQVDVREVCLLFMDCDLYQGHLAAYRHFVPRMPKGALVIVEDYGTPDCPGAKKATDEYFGIDCLGREMNFPGLRIQ